MKKKLLLLLVSSITWALVASAARAADKPAPAAKSEPAAVDASAVNLAGAYQDGYLQVVAAACFQLYSSMGIIASDLSAGHISGATALSALDQNALLLGACSGSLGDVRKLTSADDKQGQVILGRLDTMLTTLGALDEALVDAASVGDKKAAQAAAQAVNIARQQAEQALDEFGKAL